MQRLTAERLEDTADCDRTGLINQLRVERHVGQVDRQPLTVIAAPLPWNSPHASWNSHGELQ
jgi:acyl-CoA reductase-like NAD-dependent aldehyde dehydrogenase